MQRLGCFYLFLSACVAACSAPGGQQRSPTEQPTAAQAAAVQALRHPLDALSESEVASVMTILRDAGKTQDGARYPSVRLLEAAKADVLRWQPGDALQRRAFVVVYQDQRVFEAVVDITQRRLASWREIAGVQPPFVADDFIAVAEIATSSPVFRAALAKRGYTNFDTLLFLPLSAGSYGDPVEAGRRLIRVTCLDAAGTKNPFVHPIENLHADIDLEAREVLRVIDTGVVAVPRANGDYPLDTGRKASKPLRVTQPEGVDFSVKGQVVEWDRWSFHFRVEPREGLVISLASYLDKQHRRSVLYRGALSETFVPYADPSSNWYYRTYMDAGEYGIGKGTTPLEPERDCPANAQFFDATIPDDFGGSFSVPNAVCIFERTPHLLWKHFDIFSGSAESRAGRELVVRYGAIVGNYDYFFDWAFSQDAGIALRVGAGGIMEMKAAACHRANDTRCADDTRYATLVDENLLAPYHQHIFNYRLDLDVDGTDNSFAEMTPSVVRVAGSPRKSGFTVATNVFERELAARRDKGAATWKVLNEGRKNARGYAVGYTVKTDGDSELLMTSDDPPAGRAGYTQHALWVTPERADERYAAGDYPNQSEPGAGLPTWTAANRRIRSKDIVLWVNLGLTHISRSEDYPLMPTEWFGRIELAPFNFFDRSPVVDIPED